MNEEKLLLLAEHLEKPVEERLHPVFDFTEVNSLDYPNTQTRKGVPHCGTRGCAIGELPLLFPDEVQFSPQTKLFKFRNYNADVPYGIVAQDIFEISSKEAILLFSPAYFTRLPWWPEKTLGSEATANEVAESIRRFVEWKKAGGSIA